MVHLLVTLGGATIGIAGEELIHKPTLSEQGVVLEEAMIARRVYQANSASEMTALSTDDESSLARQLSQIINDAIDKKMDVTIKIIGRDFPDNISGRANVIGSLLAYPAQSRERKPIIVHCRPGSVLWIETYLPRT